MPALRKEAGVALYELEIAIARSADDVWKALIEETNAWWLPDFHMTGAGSKVTFEAHAGGRVVEEHEDGSSLLWYTVQFFQPSARTVYLQGSLAPDWGGPTSNMLKLAVEGDGQAAVLKVSDAHFGFIDDATIGSLESGWLQLFTDGLKRFVEEGVRQD